jgi:hypothetical protein
MVGPQHAMEAVHQVARGGERCTPASTVISSFTGRRSRRVVRRRLNNRADAAFANFLALAHCATVLV